MYNIDAIDESAILNKEYDTIDDLKILSIIVMGLKAMCVADFEEPDPNLYMTHTAFPNLYMAPQTRAVRGVSGKTSPTVDFTFNGDMQVAIEISKNSYDILGKIKKFSSGGVYEHFGLSALCGTQNERE